MNGFKLSNITWGKDIIEEFPDIYINNDDNREMNLRYSFEFQEGWRNQVVEFSKVSDALVKYLKSSGIQPNAFIRACIFKEKFGTLTWQGDDNLIYPFNKLFHGFVMDIENQSAHTCEVCGNYGRLRQGNLRKTTCTAHEKREVLL